MKTNAVGNYEMTIDGHTIEIAKVRHDSRDRRRSCGRGTQRYFAVYSWSSFVDGRLALDGCGTMRAALEAAKASLA